MLRYCAVVLCFCYVICEHLDLPEGSQCSWNNVTGQCVNVYRCLSAVVDIKKENHPPICTYQDELPIICCTDCELVNDTRLFLFNENLGILEKTGYSKTKDKCLDYIHVLKYPCKVYRSTKISKILETDSNCHVLKQGTRRFVATGGRAALRGEFRHMALLGYGESMDTAQWLCGGSVISERFILTAGHCLSGPEIGPVKYIVFGILKRTDSPELWQKYNVKRAIPHPEYKPPSKYHDIALLETDEEISFASNVLPACLHVSGGVDDSAEATGWGALGHKERLADNLQAVKVFKFSEEECSEQYPQHRHLLYGYNHTTQMCYGDKETPKDTCKGDSGGPLQLKGFCVWRILGVTSFGRACGISGGSGIYTRVAPYVPWIESILQW